MHWAVEHRSRILLYGGLVLAVVVLAISFYALRNSQEQKASVALAGAFETWGAPIVPAGTPATPGFTTYTTAKERSAAANKQFAAVADKYSTESGKMARYMEGVTFSELGDYANAEKNLKDAAEHGGVDLANLAKFALASVYRQSNRENDAINEYQEIINHPSRSVGKAMAQMELASIYATKQPDKAKSLLQEVAKDNPNTSVAELATQKIGEIK